MLAIWRSLSAVLTARATTLKARAAAGMIRDCHADLRAEHVLVDDPPAVVDCVEFNSTLRALDVADDLAFLVMDLCALGNPHLANRLIASYRTAGGDPGDDALLAFYACHRALVRAKVLFIRAAQLDPGSAEHDAINGHAHDLISLAECFVWHARLPVLIVVCGVPASGKTVLCNALHAVSGLTHLSSDAVRKQLAGVSIQDRAPLEAYSPEFGHATYAELGRRARIETEQHGAAIVDATFRRQTDRSAFAETFAGVAPVLFVQCAAPTRVLARRAAQRELGDRGGSDATLEVVLRERDQWDPLDEVRADAHLILRSDQPLTMLIDELSNRLDERPLCAEGIRQSTIAAANG